MLEKAIFRKHTNLFLYMMSREHFSQKEIILYSLENHEFKDKDSWENKGQFRDKLIKLGLLKKYSFREFKERYPLLAEDAGRAYEKSHERKRIILSFESIRLLGMALSSIDKLEHSEIINLIPIKKFAARCIEYERAKKRNQTNCMILTNYINSFISGCAVQRILVFDNNKITELISVFASRAGEFDEEELSITRNYVLLARNMFEENIKRYIELKG